MTDEREKRRTGSDEGIQSDRTDHHAARRSTGEAEGRQIYQAGEESRVKGGAEWLI